MTDTWEEEVLEEVGGKLRPMRDLVFLRTDATPKEIKTRGGIILCGLWQDFHKGYGNEKVIRAEVLSIGKDVVTLKPGEVIAFQRLFFMRHSYMSDGSLLGWVQEKNILGWTTEDSDIAPAFQFERATPHSLVTQ